MEPRKVETPVQRAHAGPVSRPPGSPQGVGHTEMKTNLAVHAQDSRTRHALVSPTLPIALALLAGWRSGGLAGQVLVFQQVRCVPRRSNVARAPWPGRWPSSIESTANCWQRTSSSVMIGASASALTSRRAMTDVTRILSAIEQGEPHAAEQLLPLVYNELRKLAAQKLAHERPGQTLQATALVHEAYLRLVASPARKSGEPEPQWNSRGHFFAAAAEAMRRILVDNARRKQTCKHGGGRQRQDMDLDALIAQEPNLDLLALDAALRRLVEQDPLKAKLVELRYFAGLTGDQAAAVLGISTSSADRHWVYTRAWLRREFGFGVESVQKSEVKTQRSEKNR